MEKLLTALEQKGYLSKDKNGRYATASHTGGKKSRKPEAITGSKKKELPPPKAWIGTLVMHHGAAFFRPRKQSHLELKVRGSYNPAWQDDVVVAKPDAKSRSIMKPMVQIVESLGLPDNQKIDLQMVAKEMDLPVEFPLQVIHDSNSLRLDGPDPALKREDLRSLPFCTIDGVDAKDFDDAVCWQEPNILYVAVADVASYVRKDSPLDVEAAHRGNSYYFPGTVFPMLPEALSNNLCSLRPREDRRVLVARMELGFAGKTLEVHCKLFPALIHSHGRLTYDDVQNFLDQKPHTIPADLQSMLKTLAQVAREVRKLRLTTQSLELQGSEKKVALHTDGTVKGLIKRQAKESEQLIEECMLLANVEVARFLKQHKLPCFWRAHPAPEEAKLTELAELLALFKIKVSPKFREGDPQAIRLAMQKVLASPQAAFLPHFFLRAMNQAFYTASHESHYGLGFKDYVHFTSPIRRYADLINHRSLHTYWKQKNVPERDLVPEAYSSMANVGTHISQTERIAQRAEFDVFDLKATRYMQQHIGQTFTGIIVKCLKFGLICELQEHPVSAFIPRERFAERGMYFDLNKQTWTSRQRKRTLAIGTLIDIRIDRASIPDARIWGTQL